MLMFCRPLYSSTRLNGIPIQMLAMMTDHSDQVVDVVQPTLLIPTAFRPALTTPDSLFSIQDQVAPVTISGSNHGTSSSARKTLDNRKCW